MLYYNKNKQIPFIKHSLKAIFVSLLFFVLSIFLIISNGLNLSIDFKGGILLEVKVKDEYSIKDLRSQLNLNPGLGAKIQEFGSEKELMIRIKNGVGNSQEIIKHVKSILKPYVAEFRRVEFVGPVVGEELKEKAVYAVIYSLLAILIYIWFRFEWQYGLFGLVALFHDVILTIGFFAFTQIEFSLATVSAILTIAGYSINDTVVVYDRVRENFKLYEKKSYNDIFNMSINQTLRRSVMTSATTLLTLFSLYFFGGKIIADFAIAMIFGVIIGTYSSNAIAVPLLQYLKPKRGDDDLIDPIKKEQLKTKMRT